MLRSVTIMLCVIAASAVPTMKDAPARTLAKKPAEVKALDDQIASIVAEQLQARDAEAKKVAALAQEKQAQLEALADKIAARVTKMATTSSSTCTCQLPTGQKCGAPFPVASSNDCTKAKCLEPCGKTDPNDVASLYQDSSSDSSSSSSSSSGGSSSSSSSSDSKSNSDSKTTTSSGGCFSKVSTTACLLASPAAECEHVLMADLAVGDLVLGRDGATTVVAVQHKAVDTLAEMLTFHTADGASVSMTPDHAIFANGQLVAAAEVKVGSILSTGAVERVTKGEDAIINAVTASGTIVADGVVAASNPLWIASITVDAPITRAVVNAVLYAVGDVDTVAAGTAKVATTLLLGALGARALRKRKASSA